MKIPDARTLQLLVVRYRSLFIVLLVILMCFSLFGLGHRGRQVLVAVHAIQAGSKITSADVDVAYLESGVDSPAISSLGTAQFAAQSIYPGAVITNDLLTTHDVSDGRVVVSVPLESSAALLPRVGARVHVWALGDEFTALVSSDGVVIGGVAGNTAMLSIPSGDERAVMQAGAVRLAVVGQP